MLEWKDRRMEARERGVGEETDEILILVNDPDGLFDLAFEHIAHEASVMFFVVFACDASPVGRLVTDDGRGDELRVRMNDGASSGYAVIFEDDDVFDTFIAGAGSIAFAVSEHQFFDVFEVEHGDEFIVSWRIDDDFVNAEAVHGGLKEVARASGLNVFIECGIFIFDDACLP